MLTYPDFEYKQILFALLSYGDKLSFKNDNIIITNVENKIKHQSTCYKLLILFVIGHITITSGLLQRSKKFGFSIIILSHSFKFIGMWPSKTEGNVLLRKKQYDYNKLDIAFHILYNKVYNQIRTLQFIRNKNKEIEESIAFLNKQLILLKNIQGIELQQLLGIEGVSSRVYFKGLYANFNWNGRKPRIKPDEINCLLDIGYTILFNIIDALLNCYGFDTYKGVYHTNFYQRKSLVCDLVEPFRSLIDIQVRKAHNLKIIKKEDFCILVWITNTDYLEKNLNHIFYGC
jgi:CRISPR-associated protein Cas1